MTIQGSCAGFSGCGEAGSLAGLDGYRPQKHATSSSTANLRGGKGSLSEPTRSSSRPAAESKEGERKPQRAPPRDAPGKPQTAGEGLMIAAEGPHWAGKEGGRWDPPPLRGPICILVSMRCTNVCTNDYGTASPGSCVHLAPTHSVFRRQLKTILVRIACE